MLKISKYRNQSDRIINKRSTSIVEEDFSRAKCRLRSMCRVHIAAGAIFCKGLSFEIMYSAHISVNRLSALTILKYMLT